jgi:NAD(P)-dependent dehydrogenase (short-subunit alcohol dehydrogenase family)
MALEKRVAVISGATGGLGRVVVRQLAERGAHLALLGREAERLARLARELGLPDERYLAQAADLNDPSAVRAAADAVLERFGRVEILLHLVGGWVGGKPVVEVAAEDVALMLQQHVWTTFHLAQAFVPHLVANRWGRVLVVSSPLAFHPGGKGAPYAIGKAGQQALLLSLAQELKGTGVTANILLVGSIDVKHERDRAPSSKTASWATPEEIASMLVYLCSDEARIVNGAMIPMHGGP